MVGQKGLFGCCARALGAIVVCRYRDESQDQTTITCRFRAASGTRLSQPYLDAVFDHQIEETNVWAACVEQSDTLVDKQKRSLGNKTKNLHTSPPNPLAELQEQHKGRRGRSSHQDPTSAWFVSSRYPKNHVDRRPAVLRRSPSRHTAALRWRSRLRARRTPRLSLCTPAPPEQLGPDPSAPQPPPPPPRPPTPPQQYDWVTSPRLPHQVQLSGARGTFGTTRAPGVPSGSGGLRAWFAGSLGEPPRSAASAPEPA